MSTKRTSAKEQTKENSYTLKESKIIPNSPFQAHKYNDFWIITSGKYRHGNNFDDYDSAAAYVNTVDWSLLSIVVQALIDANNNSTNVKQIK